MKLNITETQPQVKQINITVEKDDYSSKLDSEFKKIRKTAQLKGFRKGKTPLSVVKKFYGEQTMAKIVTDMLEAELGNALKEKELDVILQPQMSESTPQHEFNPSDMKDYEFIFEAPVFDEFEIKGLSDSDSIIKYNVEIDSDTIDTEMENMAKRQGTQEEAESDITENDIVTIHANELDEKGKVKAKGWETGFDVLVGELADDYKKEVIGKDKDFEFDFDIYHLEKDKSEKYVKKYLLNLDEEEEKEIGNQFKGKINKISRMKPAEINEEFFEKAFPGSEIKTEEEAREKVKSIYKDHYDSESDKFLQRNVMEHIIEENQFALPDEYLKQYLLTNNEGLTEEVLEKEYDDFANNLRWNAVKQKLNDKYEVKVEFDEIQGYFEDRFKQMVGGNVPPGMDLTPYIQEMMKNQEDVMKAYNELASSKLLDRVAEDITLQEEKVSIEKFGELVKELNEKVNN